jgi:putative hemolysin
VDEYGDFLGLVTLTDVLSAIAGALPEEHQQPVEHIVQRADGTWLVDGRVSIGDLGEKLGLRDIAGDFHTAAGLALERLARIPAEGDRFAIGDWQVEVIDMDGKRIDKLLFTPPRSDAAPAA